MAARGKQVEKWAKSVKRNKRYKFPAIKSVSPRVVIYSIGNKAKNMAITLYSDRWLLDLLW